MKIICLQFVRGQMLADGLHDTTNSRFLTLTHFILKCTVYTVNAVQKGSKGSDIKSCHGKVIK